ncbi:glycosyltransferase family 2 protein [Leuconostoc citreum]|uniref:glycosyltransferase family 2 protein n=1 Tax=Leuconostoc citreum TaxID=33964 RepID=UPI0021A4454E|nr:glycosyltransferase family 2 protein [Leuconostoc citreum]MCT3058293.1 glycosyltransferase family 2 protein [Leuconostoc citreum]MDY5161174.1 glycosyltransferase family 2 protein [Leuconostoc citreum]MDY5164744.1 glycosyltransferase family 2 protein [Leuconostoc citreum]
MTPKLVSIIIPYHNENEQQLAIALSSINNQIGIDFNRIEVILIGDGGYKIPDLHVFDIFANIKINYYYFNQSQGAGMARQKGMDIASGRYYMFMDADDELHFAGALLEFFNVVSGSGNHEVIIAKYIEQYKTSDNTFRYVTHPQNDWKAAYAKWFSADYIEQIDLHWQKDLRIFEDTYFVGLACELADNIYYHDSVVYSWLYNANSTVRDKKKAFFNQLSDWVLANRHYFEIIRDKKPQNLQNNFEAFIADLYFWEQLYKPANQQKYDIQLSLLMQENKDLWQACKNNLPEIVAKLSENGAKRSGQDVTQLSSFIIAMENIR